MDNNGINEKIIQDLFAMRDEKYADFHSKLMPTVERSLIIGVRVPMLRKYAKDLSKKEEAAAFLSVLPHKYYEENNLHAFLIQGISDIDLLLAELERFLPYTDNWATCDMLRPKIFAKHKDKLLERIHQWLASDHTYTVRYAIGMLLVHFLDEDFSPEYPKLVADIKSEEYYINMMRAWYFAEALAKQYDSILPYIENKVLDVWTHRKAVQKAIESFRITNEQKAYLGTLK